MDGPFYCPLDDGADFPGSTNCGGADFGSRLRLDMHYAQAHLDTGEPAFLGLASGSRRPSSPADYADALRALRPFIGSVDPDFHGSPVVPYSGGWGMLGTAAGIGQGLPQALYVVWSQGTPIAWYLNDRTDEGWVFPEGDYYKYDRVTSRHQNKISAALAIVGEHPRVTPAWPDPWAETPVTEAPGSQRHDPQRPGGASDATAAPGPPGKQPSGRGGQATRRPPGRQITQLQRPSEPETEMEL